jgi:pseudaminic acid cytidylyltransferase
MKKLKRLLIIPARGGSKRIKNKNIKKFKKKPIIYYSIENAIKSRLFNKIHVSTDSKKILEIIKKKIKVDFIRPKKLSNDKTPLFKVYKFVVEEYLKKGLVFDEIWSIMPCTPNLNNKDLKKISIFYNDLKIKNPVLGISKYPVPIEWAYTMDKFGKLRALDKKLQLVRSQDIKHKYFDAGQFYIYPGNKFHKLNFLKKNYSYIGYRLPFEKSIDIDDIEDWKLAEKL